MSESKLIMYGSYRVSKDYPDQRVKRLRYLGPIVKGGVTCYSFDLCLPNGIFREILTEDQVNKYIEWKHYERI
jgi:hypothetical protein